MCGKKPKERDRYVLRMPGGTLVEVSREVYLEWYQSRRREKYQQERKQKYGVCSLDEMAESGWFYNSSSVKIAYEPENEVIRKDYIERLEQALKQLSRQERFLIYLLYYEQVTIKEAAQRCKCCRKTIHYRRNKILRKLRNVIRD